MAINILNFFQKFCKRQITVNSFIRMIIWFVTNYPLFYKIWVLLIIFGYFFKCLLKVVSIFMPSIFHRYDCLCNLYCMVFFIKHFKKLNANSISYLSFNFKFSPNLIQVIFLEFKFSRPFKVNTQVLTWISQCWESVKHQLASDEGVKSGNES